MGLVAILGDWGTTNVRLWAISESNEVFQSITLNKGMSQLNPSDYEPIIQSFIESCGTVVPESVDVLLCGMAGARQGWKEATYSLISSFEAPRAVRIETVSSAINVYVLPGLKQLDPPDVMRGEETQIEGFISDNPSFSGVICLPGTHSKWVDIANGSARSFRTAMTGEIYSLLKQHSTLSFTMDDAWNQEEFIESVKVGFEQGHALLSSLFSQRALKLSTSTNICGSSTVSGLLIGAEFKSCVNELEINELYFIGGDFLTELYVTAASALGLKAKASSGDQLVLKGLMAAYKQFRDGGLCIES